LPTASRTPWPPVLLLAKAFERAAVSGDHAASEFLLADRVGELFRGDGPRFGDLVERLRHFPTRPRILMGNDDRRRLEAMPG